jgi:hypothetical protein
VTIHRATSRWRTAMRALPRALAWTALGVAALLVAVLLWDTAARGWE